MRIGLLIPVGNDALAFAFIAAIIITVIWFAFQLISHIATRSRESSFNKCHQHGGHEIAANPQELSQLLSSMPLRKANFEGGTLVFWTNDDPISLAVACANPQSSFKVFLRSDRPASEMGHKLMISSSDTPGISFRLTAESLIFSNSESTFYDVDADSLSSLAKMLKENSCHINNCIEITKTNAESLTEWISKVMHVSSHSQARLLLGE